MKIAAPFAASIYAALMLALPFNAVAQNFPTKPIRVLIGFAPGAGPDLLARMLGPAMTKQLGQPIVIDNREGASGLIATQVMSRADPDGHTLFFGGMTSVTSTFIKEGYVNGDTLAPVSQVVAQPWIIFSSGKLSAATVSELQAYAKANPGKLNFAAAAASVGLVGEVLKNRLGIDFTVVPYKSNPQVVTALVSGEADLAGGSYSPAFDAQIKAGGMRAMLVAGSQRMPAIPNVQTAADAGVRNFAPVSIMGYWAPLKTPRAITGKLSDAVIAASKLPENLEQFRKNYGVDPSAGTPEEQMKAYQADFTFWAEAAKIANYKPQ